MYMPTSANKIEKKKKENSPQCLPFEITSMRRLVDAPDAFQLYVPFSFPSLLETARLDQIHEFHPKGKREIERPNGLNSAFVVTESEHRPLPDPLDLRPGDCCD
jgi:hypothetical protein